jgi:hypothetical protein
MHAGNQLNETMGTVNILPQLLAPGRDLYVPVWET